MNLEGRKRVKRQVPMGCREFNLTQFGMAAFLAGHQPGDKLFMAKVETHFTPSCPNPDPAMIPFDEWVAVDSMTCKSTFKRNFRQFESLVASCEPYFKIVLAATEIVLAKLLERKSISMTRECEKLVLPTILNHLVYRCVILDRYHKHGDVSIVADELRFTPGEKKRQIAFRVRLTRLDLDMPSIMNPLESKKVLEYEKFWLRPRIPV